jgi:hypothetical protein
MRDPKQWAKVPVCLKREIVAAMGGQNSELYVHFRKLAVEAYMILRKHASTFLTLLACMSGSAIECFSADSSSVSLEFAIAQVRSKQSVAICACSCDADCFFVTVLYCTAVGEVGVRVVVTSLGN